ncbi:MAG: glycosyltransferase, partial [Acidobacteria bacterium]|nr:glycosyltransferase [Acidobacteriota bacterium]
MDVSIVIPTYNRGSSAVECVLALDHNQADIIVVDDGSDRPIVLPPGTGRVIRHERHRGRPVAVNTGLKAASNDLVLIIDDDIYAAPDMVTCLVDRFSRNKNPKLALTARVVWDPDVPLTLTMQWLEEAAKFPAPILLWRPFVVEHGGYDENFTRGLDDLELQLRLKPHGFEVRPLESAVGFQNKTVRIRDLVEVQFMEGVSAVYLHSKFPEHLPQVDDMELLLRNQQQTRDAEAAVEEIALLEQAESNKIPAGASDLFAHVSRHYFLHGVFERLRDIGGVKPRRPNSSTLAVYHQASHLEGIGEFDEARRLFQLVLHRPDEEYWGGAEYHLGSIESVLGNDKSAQFHFIECLKRNPGHNKARRALNKSSRYVEVAPNVFQVIERGVAPKVLFILFGDAADVINAFPVVAAMREKFSAEIVWLTLPEYTALARASSAGAVRESEPRGIIPWDWIHSEDF